MHLYSYACNRIGLACWPVLDLNCWPKTELGSCPVSLAGRSPSLSAARRWYFVFFSHSSVSHCVCCCCVASCCHFSSGTGGLEGGGRPARKKHYVCGAWQLIHILAQIIKYLTTATKVRATGGKPEETLNKARHFRRSLHTELLIYAIIGRAIRRSICGSVLSF